MPFRSQWIWDNPFCNIDFFNNFLVGMLEMVEGLTLLSTLGVFMTKYPKYTNKTRHKEQKNAIWADLVNLMTVYYVMCSRW